ncbi:TraB/GumN family protein [Bhargavaea cecembensis]|uniref:TraB/GumN family protein n=1 Tax=Bhargavaea cecembensis TaxID=394098 RepID=UPI000590EDC1|nr:TraB/GumN family protein [Bhargavaea cecembensis]
MNDDNITRIQLGDKELILIGTAHVSRLSAEQVKEVIEREQPDTVAIELDEQRYQAVTGGNKWKETDIFKVIKEKKASLLLMNLAISSFQNRMAKQFDVTPGAEMIQGIDSAKETGAELILADRNIQTTFSRIWGNLGAGGKAQLLTSVIASIFSREEISEEEMEKMKSQDTLNAVLAEFTESFPRLKTPLIDERDQYLAEKLRTAPGKKIVAVLGAAHVPGISREIHKTHDLETLNAKPPKPVWPKVVGWGIPLLIIGIIAYTFIQNSDVAMNQMLSWLLWNGSLAALGTILAKGHPLAVLTAFAAAPFTSLNPLLAVGWFSGLVQAYFSRPSVGDFEKLTEDVLSVKGFWQNKATRVLLVVVLGNIGSSLGTFIGGADVIRSFFQHIF